MYYWNIINSVQTMFDGKQIHDVKCKYTWSYMSMAWHATVTLCCNIVTIYVSSLWYIHTTHYHISCLVGYTIIRHCDILPGTCQVTHIWCQPCTHMSVIFSIATVYLCNLIFVITEQNWDDDSRLSKIWKRMKGCFQGCMCTQTGKWCVLYSHNKAPSRDFMSCIYEI